MRARLRRLVWWGFRPAPLTVSGNEITDATRRTATQGDGRALPDLSFGIWQATTNLCTNGGFETNTTGWTTGGTNTIARSTVQQKFGAASLLCTYQNNATLASFAITLTAVAHSLSVWLYIPANYDGTQLSVQFSGFVGATGTLSVNANMALTDQWQAVEVPNVGIVAGDLAGDLIVSESGTPTAGRFIYVDGVQCEALASVTPYVETDGGTAARTVARVRVPNARERITEAQGWFAILLRMGDASSGAVRNFFEFADGVGNRLLIWKDAGSGITAMYRIGGGAGGGQATQTTTWARGDSLTIIAAWTPALVKISLNGAVFTSLAQSTVPALAVTSFDVGGPTTSGGGVCVADVRAAAFGRGQLDDGAAAAIYAVFRDNRAGLKPNRLPGDPTGYWLPETAVYLAK